MATDAIVRLDKVLDLEEKQGLRNRAVVGGLQAMAPRWTASAREEGANEEVVRRVNALMLAYGRPETDRKEMFAALRGVLRDDFDAADALLANPSTTSTPAPGPQPRTSNYVPAKPPAESASSANSSTSLSTNLSADRSMDAASQEGEGAPVAPNYVAASPATEPVIAAKPRAEEPRPQQPKQPQQQGQKQAQQPAKQKAPKGAPQPQTNPEDAPVIGATYVFEYEGAKPQAKQPKAHNRPPRTREELQSSPLLLEGVGPSINEMLGKVGIHKVEDFLRNLPLRYEDFTRMRTIAEVKPGEQATIIANLWAVSERSLGFKRSRVDGVVGDGTGTLTAVWWNKWVKKDLQEGTTLRLSGKVGLYMGKKTLENPIFEPADSESLAAGRIAPVYRLTEGLSQKKMRALTHQVIEDFGKYIDDPLPEEIRREHNLTDLREAITQAHFPDDERAQHAARRRLSFEEFLYIQVGVLQHRRDLKGAAAPAFQVDDSMLLEFTSTLPFFLTGAQQRVLGEIAADLRHPVPMTRLVQGDVGSGKTAVAAGAMYAAARNGAQSAMLAPTQILAEQHARALQKLLAGVSGPDGNPLEVALLTGRVTGAERERVLAGLRDGTIPIVAGTTALIQETVEFANLGLVIVDEQHRFGVEQRGALRTNANTQPHMLVMSATPIPRSLQLTIYGELDISILNEMPAGRLPVKTVVFRPFERERVYGFLRKEAAEGRQAFIVYPLVEESDVLLELGAATEAYERLQKEVFPDLRLALLHGQMKGSEKDAIMRAFAAREYDILVSTSVIEVGIDVPNATVIVIEDAERFGLAQLHQFRGRVGRGDQRSFCVLVSRSEGDAASERLNILATTNDGFVLAEKDLELRGPGDFLGTRQTGLPELQVALFSDVATMQQARDAAEKLLRDDPELENHPTIAAGVERIWRGHGDIS